VSTLTWQSPARRVALASVNREMREWSAEHGDDLWNFVDFDLCAEAPSAPVSEVLWLRRHITHVEFLCLNIHKVSFGDAE